MQMSTPQAEQGMLEHIAFEDDPNKRLEWQMMLRSVLESEVLSSETKRITSVDASVPAPGEMMYDFWLKMRAMRYGNIEGRNDSDMEQKVLQEIQQQVMPTLIEDITRARDFGAVSPSSERRRTPGEAPPTAAAGDAEDDNLTRASPEQRAEAMREVAALLARVDVAESLFPSQRQMLAAFPAWGSPAVQQKLAALYSWYNMTRSLQAQAVVLAKWTGSLTGPGGIVGASSTW